MSKERKTLLYLSSYLIVAIEAFINAFSYEIFIYPNGFAPAGVGGIATIMQHLTHISAGYYIAAINAPLLIVSFFALDKNFTLKSLTHTVVFSLASIFFHSIDVSKIAFAAPDAGGRALAAIAGGVFSGVLYYVAVRSGGSTGGADIIGAAINKKKPEFEMVWVIFTVNVIIAVSSFFVFGSEEGGIASSYEPVILCIIYCFVSSTIADYIFKGGKSAVKFEIITNYPDEISQEILDKLHHGCTILSGTGAYSHSDKKVLICIVNRRQIAACEKILKKYDKTFAFMENVNGTFGVFDRKAK